MTDQPLGTPHDTDQPTVSVKEPSIVDTILNLDELLSADVRRAERTARFCTRPDLEAEMDDLEAQLDALTDSQGNVEPTGPDRGEQTLGEAVGGGDDAVAVAQRIHDLRHEYAAAFRSIRLRAMTSDDWDAFQDRHRKTLEGQPPYAKTMWSKLVAACAVAPTITAQQLTTLRSKLSPTAIATIQQTAWDVNVGSGVSIPKSRLSSVVLQRSRRAKS